MEVTTDESIETGTVFLEYPPNTGSAKCDICGGWIMGSLWHIVDGEIVCSICYGY